MKKGYLYLMSVACGFSVPTSVLSLSPWEKGALAVSASVTVGTSLYEYAASQSGQKRSSTWSHIPAWKKRLKAKQNEDKKDRNVVYSAIRALTHLVSATMIQKSELVTGNPDGAPSKLCTSFLQESHVPGIQVYQTDNPAVFAQTDSSSCVVGPDFKTLSCAEQQAVLGHELAHCMYKDTMWGGLSNGAIAAGVPVMLQLWKWVVCKGCNALTNRCSSTSIFHTLVTMFKRINRFVCNAPLTATVLTLLAQKADARRREYRADLHACRSLGTTQGALSYLNREETGGDGWFSSHPTSARRIAHLIQSA